MIKWNGRKVNTGRVLTALLFGLAVTHATVGGLAASSNQAEIDEAQRQNKASQWKLIRSQSEAAQLRAQLQAANNELHSINQEIETAKVEQILIQSSSASAYLNHKGCNGFSQCVEGAWCECLSQPEYSFSRSTWLNIDDHYSSRHRLPPQWSRGHSVDPIQPAGSVSGE
ncbi:MAG: hypothetical protein P1V97_11590 [Planctomycetota bacterium]|nr:hypothetical protein [Planctomycetota bacterium]